MIFKSKTTLKPLWSPAPTNKAQQIGLKISQKKTEVMTLNTPNPSPVQVNGEDLLKTEELTGLGSTVRCDGGAGNNVKNRFRKARNT